MFFGSLIRVVDHILLPIRCLDLFLLWIVPCREWSLEGSGSVASLCSLLRLLCLADETQPALVTVYNVLRILLDQDERKTVFRSWQARNLTVEKSTGMTEVPGERMP